jgi:NADH:ubiquinone oxidoreductase subunit 6 (subunit J)
LALELFWAIGRLDLFNMPGKDVAPSNVHDIGVRLFKDYAFAFEATSALILVAMVGAVILARKEPR